MNRRPRTVSENKKDRSKSERPPGRDRRVICEVFRRSYKRGMKSVPFHRDDMKLAAKDLGIEIHDNVGAVIYDYRFRKALPEEIRSTATDGLHWRIRLAGRSKYTFVLGPPSAILPRIDMAAIKIPDATPELVNHYRLDDEQAVLAKVRYNRLIDVFLGITAYSLQNHLRTSVEDIGQIEIDELYIGINRTGAQYAIPVQAKGGTDKLSKVQSEQDLEYCRIQYPELVCRPVSVQFMSEDVIAMFELRQDGDDIGIIAEQHYRLVPFDQITADELRAYKDRSAGSAA